MVGNFDMHKPKTVAAYIAEAPSEHRGKLRELRAVIRRAAPDAVEKISYRMPYYHYKGRLAYFALFKNHIGLYVPTPVIAEHTRELERYETSSATVRLPHGEKLPVALVRKLIRAGMAKNEEREAGRKSVKGR
jgi:uncharacterized protein YdhG (YjbR/CyaY superfamily)